MNNGNDFKDFNLENILAAKINNEIFSLGDTPKNDATIDFIDMSDVTGRKIYKCGKI